MEVRLSTITIEKPSAPILGRSGERAEGHATVTVTVSSRPHNFELTFRNHPFKTLDELTENIRKQVQEIGAALAEAAEGPLL